jgi:hypothetical protein
MRQLGGETTLANPGLAGDQNQALIACHSVDEVGAEQLDLSATSNEDAG